MCIRDSSTICFWVLNDKFIVRQCIKRSTSFCCSTLPAIIYRRLSYDTNRMHLAQENAFFFGQMREGGGKVLRVNKDQMRGTPPMRCCIFTTHSSGSGVSDGSLLDNLSRSVAQPTNMHTCAPGYSRLCTAIQHASVKWYCSAEYQLLVLNTWYSARMPIAIQVRNEAKQSEVQNISMPKSRSCF